MSLSFLKVVVVFVFVEVLIVLGSADSMVSSVEKVLSSTYIAFLQLGTNFLSLRNTDTAYTS